MTEGASLKVVKMVLSKLAQTIGSHRNSFGLYITEELVGRKRKKKLSALCWWESQNNSTIQSHMSVVVWGEHLYAPEHPGWVLFSFSLQKSLLWLQRDHKHQEVRCSSALNVHWKHLYTKFHSHYTWTHVFGHVSSIWKPEGWKMFLGLWRGEGEGKDGEAVFSASGSLNQSCNGVKYLFLLCCFIVTKAPSYTPGAAQAWQQSHLR